MKKQKSLNSQIAMLIIAITLFVVVMVQSLIIDDLKEEQQMFQEKLPEILDYRYNFTRCVFNYGYKTVVCNLVMRDSCLEITEIDENCEVLE